MDSFRILLADDHEIVRRGLRAVLETQPGWQICGEVNDGRKAVEKALQLKPDVIILDISMPALNGLEATRQILKGLPNASVLILTMHDSEEMIRQVLDAGARGYLLKSDAGDELVAAVDALRRHKTYFTSKVDHVVLAGYLEHKAQGREIRRDRLTPRQREIVQLLAEGKTSKEVATALKMSVKTAETHRSNIMKKLDLHSVSDLVRYAIRNKMVEP